VGRSAPRVTLVSRLEFVDPDQTVDSGFTPSAVSGCAPDPEVGTAPETARKPDERPAISTEISQ
jgi:hypothetical protein